MKSKILKITCTAVLTVVSGITVYHAQDKKTLSDLTLANVEALASNESQGMKYERKKNDITEIWDDATGTYKKVIVTICEG